ncbi:glycosyltransferase family 2 protein [Dethiosulfatarculus sandiegensis]|uniref:Glycosyltransferase 2-like domain-containing protein n=1 Tax=Dethiosulfatarculus sandiegensis TaxID=1429043 RepID=A0A0D2JBP0_9BACT|nr:glycosyltransferase family 2 protein [Dethiosulfatarculus sandiegensis]KIX13201.1 hypothetical protein X474_14875 [Dethiosulfatarculus sandiegensis]
MSKTLPSADSESGFKAASIILPIMNETHSLSKTIEIIESECADLVGQYLIVACDRTEEESLKRARVFTSRDSDRFQLFFQELPFLGGAMRDAFSRVSGSHVVMMASDLETDPHDVKHLISMAQRYPADITTCSRWVKGGDFAGYDKLKLVLNYLFQKFFSLVFSCNLSDMTYGYRIFPTALVKSVAWQEVRHPFLFETLVKPLRLGVKVHEIPSQWKAREEGESQNTFLRNFEYFRTGLAARFADRDSLIL